MRKGSEVVTGFNVLMRALSLRHSLKLMFAPKHIRTCSIVFRRKESSHNADKFVTFKVISLILALSKILLGKFGSPFALMALFRKIGANTIFDPDL